MNIPPHLAHLPPPPPEAQALGDRLTALITGEIAGAGGWISFARFMELALYAPGLGYYSAGSRKLGRDGDFVTAPEFSPLFSRCLARQLAELISRGLTGVLEIGAGSGALAADLLPELAALGCAPDNYFILEVSADLRERQRARIAARAPQQAAKVQWLDVLPASLNGVIVGNEVLDAIPTHIVRAHGGIIEEMGVARSGDGAPFARAYRKADGALLAAARDLGLPDGYETEIHLAARAFVRSFARVLKRGAILFIDYGFPAHEYYHPERAGGTLMCHYRHHAHADPLCLVGLQDITTHVDFSAIAKAGAAAGLDLLGYVNQAQFLINCGITDILGETPASDVRAYAPLASQAQKLLSPAEMGELFKVIALGRDVSPPLLGFKNGDKRHTL
ncbi:MAG TPA: SAM-dependent methyltransferase [Burkholderiales bacterium]|nr:SAM-dependent methyltransferase [Burkholderiales bacterium]